VPVLLASLLGGLINVAGSIAGRVLIALGISAVTYTGLTSSLGWLQAQAVANFQGLPSEMLAVAGLLQVGNFISLIISAITVRLTLQGLTGDSFRKWVGV